MFKIKRQESKTRPTAEVEKTILEKLDTDIAVENYESAEKAAKIYETLVQCDNTSKEGMSDTVKVALISAGTSLLGIVAVIRHEHLNVIASKALGFVSKAKI